MLIHAHRIMGEKQAEQIMIAFTPLFPPSVSLLIYAGRRGVIHILSSFGFSINNRWQEKGRRGRRRATEHILDVTKSSAGRYTSSYRIPVFIFLMI